MVEWLVDGDARYMHIIRLEGGLVYKVGALFHHKKFHNLFPRFTLL